MSSSEKRVSLHVSLWVFDALSDVGLRLQFRNSSGSIVDTIAGREDNLELGVNMVGLEAMVPSTAATVDVQAFGLSNDTLVWVDDVIYDAHSDEPPDTEIECDQLENTLEANWDTACANLCAPYGGVETSVGGCSTTWYGPPTNTCDLDCVEELAVCRCNADDPETDIPQACGQFG